MDKVSKGFAFSKYYKARIRRHLIKLAEYQFNTGKRKHFTKQLVNFWGLLPQKTIGLTVSAGSKRIK